MRYSNTIVFLVLVACSPADQNETREHIAGDEEKAIRLLLETYYRDMSDRSWDKYRSHFWNDATITTAWYATDDSVERVHIITIEDFIAATPQGPDSQPLFSERMIEADVHIEGKLATAWVDYDAEFGKPDSLIRWSGTDVFTFMKHDCDWKVVSLVFASKG